MVKLKAGQTKPVSKKRHIRKEKALHKTLPLHRNNTTIMMQKFIRVGVRGDVSPSAPMLPEMFYFVMYSDSENKQTDLQLPLNDVRNARIIRTDNVKTPPQAARDCPSGNKEHYLPYP
jgi:hypothetical protein